MEAKGVLQIGGMESRKFAGRPNCRKAEGQPDYQPGEDPGGSGESGSTPNGLLLPAPPPPWNSSRRQSWLQTVNGFKGHLYKVPKLTGYPIRESHRKVTEIIRGQR